MIQVEAISIRDVRGIRELELDLDRRNFVVSGPNGSGKSGVVDAIQFALTGDMSRLSGKGSRGLSVGRHGPHVDRRDDPASAEVSLKLYVPDFDRSVTLTRNLKSAKNFSLTPDDPSVRTLLEEAAAYPELTLSRREIIKYIIVEPGERSKEIQALLKLEAIGQTRGVLKTMSNKLAIVSRQANSSVKTTDDTLRRHLDISTTLEEDILAAVNPHRRTLALAEIDDLDSTTDLSIGILEGVAHAGFDRAAAIRDLDAFEEVCATLPTMGSQAVGAVLRDLSTLEADPALSEAVRRRSLVELGLELAEDAQCPLCDTDWPDDDALRAHLRAKLAKADAAQTLQERLLENGAEIGNQARGLVALVDAAQPLASQSGLGVLARTLERWSSELKALASSLDSVEAISARRRRLVDGWTGTPEDLEDQLQLLRKAVEKQPDQRVSVAAQTFLTRAQDRFSAWNSAKRQAKRAETARDAGRITYNTYCDVADGYLRALYEAVQSEFGDYYREINADDEAEFRARLEQAEAGLDLQVAFYDRGMYPPGAYHSEGHQDGMGVCLYLALMKQLLGDRFRLAVLDDVVMSVDRGHRREFCRLLKSRFPKTQFIITTHDNVWAKQMQTEGLARSKASVAFHSWSVQTGPVVEQSAGVWDAVESDAAKGEIDVAAARLRRHMEYVAHELADELVARPPFRADFSYDLGDLLPAVIRRHGDLLKRAAAAADRWNNEDAKARVKTLKTARAEALTKYGDEVWVVNKAVHYNEWATFTSAEFLEVVEAFRGLLGVLRCSTCESWLHVTPKKGTPESLRCDCGSVMLNLNAK